MGIGHAYGPSPEGVLADRVHLGAIWSSGVRANDLERDTSYDILLKVPAGTFPHILTLDLKTSDGDVDIILYEAPTLTDDGTLLHPPSNRNRASSREPSMVLWTEPVVTDEGLTLSREWIPPSNLGQGQKGDKLDPFGEDKWIFNQDTEYLYRITNNGPTRVNFIFRLVWTEDLEILT